MNTTLVVSEEVARHLHYLSAAFTDDVNKTLRDLLETEYRRRLTRYSLIDRQMSQKYEMSFEEFERQQITKRRGYSWDVESDAIAWDTAVDGIKTMKRLLSELLGQDLGRNNDHH